MAVARFPTTGRPWAQWRACVVVVAGGVVLINTTKHRETPGGRRQGRDLSVLGARNRRHLADASRALCDLHTATEAAQWQGRSNCDSLSARGQGSCGAHLAERVLADVDLHDLGTEQVAHTVVVHFHEADREFILRLAHLPAGLCRPWSPQSARAGGRMPAWGVALVS